VRVKVLHVPFCFYPDPVGGTEVYVETLAREQQTRGLDVVIAAPGPATEGYVERGLSVRRFATSIPHGDLVTLYGGGDENASQAFVDVVEREAPDVVHLHAFTSAVSARLAQAVKQRGVPLVFTYHTPAVTCQRGTLLRWGRDVCDGVIRVHTCSACALDGLGAGGPSSAVLASVAPAVGETLGRWGLAGGPWTALRMTSLVRRQRAGFRSFIQAVDRVVVLCRWVADVLVRNGVPRTKLFLSRHGLARPPVQTPREDVDSEGWRLRIAFFGRLHPTKGADTLVRAIRSLPGAHLELDLFGIIQDAASRAYACSLRELAGDDARIRVLEQVSSTEVPSRLAAYDVVAVPSRWLETGPLVVLEAFAAGVPVLGSRLGGLLELVNDGVDGLLIDTDCVQAW